jgi:hypothetical protein
MRAQETRRGCKRRMIEWYIKKENDNYYFLKKT